MERKRIFMISAMLSAACFMGACGKTDNTGLISVQAEDGRQETAVNDRKEERQVETEVKALEGEKVQETAADYDVASYESVQQFGYTLLAQNVQDKNPVLSPVSAYLALVMAGCGADGTTREAFHKVLGEDMVALSGDMISSLPANGALLKLSIADSAWIDDAFIVDHAWLDTIQFLLGADAFQADLSTEKAMNEMNRWIDNKTNGMIDQMLEQPLDEAVRLALFNTVYFKGKWVFPFDAVDTREENFYLDNDQDTAVPVKMMNLYMTDLDYIANDFAEGIVLPYQENDDGKESKNLAFIALKPTKDGDVRDVYSKLTREVITDILVNRQTELVNLKLPKFEITFDKVLNDSLSNMGLSVCFDMDEADFDPMGKTQSGDNLYISLVRQKAKIIVDEEGTEAAAVTEVLMACGAAINPQEPREVYFNEPFVYMIMDLDKELPLFIGILDEPKL